MPISGDWTLHYSWGCTKAYNPTLINFNTDGTFLDGTFPNQSPGLWIQEGSTILWIYNNGPAKFGGTIHGNVGSGAMSTFTGANGCWYLVKEGTADSASKQSHDSAGNKT
jgi:hypothetical protein